jgi:hypothetical protein
MDGDNVSIVSLIYYISISHRKEPKELWTKYIITGNQKYLIELELMIETEKMEGLINGENWSFRKRTKAL